MNFELLKRVTSQLEKNLVKISNGLKEMESFCSETLTESNFCDSSLETRVYVYFNSISSTDSKQFIINHFKSNKNGWPTSVLDNIFSPKGNEILVETQSQLNVICNELEIRRFYLAPTYSPDGFNPCFDSPLEDSATKLSKAFAVLHAAKKLLPTED